jgi:hypothetical protein
MDAIRKEQHQYHIEQKNANQRERSRKPRIIVHLENGNTIRAKFVAPYDYHTACKYRIIFRSTGKREFGLDTNIKIQTQDSPQKIDTFCGNLNDRLISLHEESVMEFPAWLEKYGSKANENNPYFNLDEIREEFKFKRHRFNLWKSAAQIGFFDNTVRPYGAKFNKITRVEIQKM